MKIKDLYDFDSYQNISIKRNPEYSRDIGLAKFKRANFIDKQKVIGVGIEEFSGRLLPLLSYLQEEFGNVFVRDMIKSSENGVMTDIHLILGSKSFKFEKGKTVPHVPKQAISNQLLVKFDPKSANPILEINTDELGFYKQFGRERAVWTKFREKIIGDTNNVYGLAYDKNLNKTLIFDYSDAFKNELKNDQTIKKLFKASFRYKKAKTNVKKFYDYLLSKQLTDQERGQLIIDGYLLKPYLKNYITNSKTARKVMNIVENTWKGTEFKIYKDKNGNLINGKVDNVIVDFYEDTLVSGLTKDPFLIGREMDLALNVGIVDTKLEMTMRCSDRENQALLFYNSNQIPFQKFIDEIIKIKKEEKIPVSDIDLMVELLSEECEQFINVNLIPFFETPEHLQKISIKRMNNETKDRLRKTDYSIFDHPIEGENEEKIVQTDSTFVSKVKISSQEKLIISNLKNRFDYVLKST